jgi:hypothetical protein
LNNQQFCVRTGLLFAYKTAVLPNGTKQYGRYEEMKEKGFSQNEKMGSGPPG